ncbi:MAG: pitrilysin family protein [Isosphaeraceae bacterium]
MSRLLRFALAAAITACAGASAALAAQGPPTKVATVEGITEYRLDNGVRLLVFPDPSTPRVTVNMTVLVGSRHEGYGETGMAHLLEHMVFKGTPGHPDIVGDMKARGAQFNGSTNSDRTNYYETLPASDDNLEFAVKLEADRLVNSHVRAEDLKTEFSVVRNEFESGENSAQRVLNQRMMATAFEWHNYGKSTIGNRSDIERVPIERLQAFYRKYYQPDNVVVVLAGKLDEKKAVELANRYFGAIPRPARTLDATYTEEPAQDGERVVTLRRVGDTPSIGLLYHVPAAAHPDSAALQVLASVLSSQPSGPLYRALVEPRKAASVFASSRGMHDPGTFEVFAGLPKGGSVDEVRDVLLATVEAVKEKGVSQEEVERARRQILKARELASNDANSTAIQLSESIAQGDWRLYFINRDRVEKVTAEQVKEVAAKYLNRSNRTVGVFLPTAQPERTPVPETPDVRSLVEGYKGREVRLTAESFDVSPLAVEARVQRPEPIGGVKVALLPKQTRGGVVQLQLTLHYGNAENLKEYTAAAGFLGDLMTRGTKSLNRQQIQDELDKNVARLSAGGGGGGPRGGGRRGGGGGGGGALGSVTFSVETKRANFPAVLEILRQVLREPSFPAEDFAVMKLGRIAAAEAGRTDPQRLAANRLQRLMQRYPADDVRYVPTVEEEVKRLEAVTLEQVRTLYKDYLGVSHGEIAVVGDFEPSEVLPILARALEGWNSGKPYARIERPFQSDIAPARETIVTPDKANAVYLAGLTMPVGDDHPDYPALVIGNFILGGGSLSSRLGDRLRQKDGLSYGASSALTASPLDRRAGLMMQAICNPTNLKRVVRGADEELARLLRDGVTAQELETAKQGYSRQQQVRRSSDAALTGQLASNLYLGRTLRHDADLEKAIQSLTPEAVASALRKHVDAKALIVVGAGDVAPGEVN